MQFHLRTFAEYVAVCTAVLVGYAFIGAPLKLLARAFGVNVGRAVSAPALGLALTMLGSWYWPGLGDGVEPVVWVLGAIGAVALVAALVWSLRKKGGVRAFLDDDTRERALLAGMCIAGTLIVMVVTYGQAFTRDQFTVLTLGNNDAPSYALLAEHLRDDGPDDPGSLVGMDLGDRSDGFSNGAYSVLAGSASMTRFDVWKVMQPTMFVGIGLGMYATALLLRHILERTHLVAIGVISVSAFAVVFLTYLVGNWFFAQILGIALVTSVLGVVFDASHSDVTREWIGAVVLVGVLLAGGLAAYPHMVVAGSCIVLPIAAVASDSWRKLFRRALLAGIVFGAGAITALLLAPGLVSDAIEITRELEGVEAGWSMSAVYPSEVLGFQTSAFAENGAGTLVFSIVLLVLAVVAGLLAWRRGLGNRVLPLFVSIAVAVGTYVYVYQREGGPTYRQWKWMTFFVPLTVAATLALVVLGISAVARNRDRQRWAIGGVLGVYVAIVVFGFGPSEGFPLSDSTTPYDSVTPDMADLAVNPVLADHPSLHVDVNQYWETMWLAYFLRDKEISIGQPSYYAVSAPISEWWIERHDKPPVPGAELIPINDTYRLADMPEPPPQDG